MKHVTSSSSSSRYNTPSSSHHC